MRPRPRLEEESRAPRSCRMAQVVAEFGRRVVVAVASATAASGTPGWEGAGFGNWPSGENGAREPMSLPLRVPPPPTAPKLIGPPVPKPTRGDRRPTEEPSGCVARPDVVAQALPNSNQMSLFITKIVSTT